MADTIHVFERAGMGVAPYHFGGMFTINKVHDSAKACIYPKLEAGLGTCAFCGHAIMNVFIVVSADGTKWGVGSSCIHKYGSGNLVKDVKKVIRERQAAKRHAKGEVARQELIAVLDDPRLKEIPHANAFWASEGQTFADEVRWHSLNAGATGCIQMAKRVKKELA